MKDSVLIALAERWEADAQTPDDHVIEDSETGVANELVYSTRRETKRECSETIRALLDYLGE